MDLMLYRPTSRAASCTLYKIHMVRLMGSKTRTQKETSDIKSHETGPVRLGGEGTKRKGNEEGKSPEFSAY